MRYNFVVFVLEIPEKCDFYRRNAIFAKIKAKTNGLFQLKTLNPRLKSAGDNFSKNIFPGSNFDTWHHKTKFLTK